MRQTRFINTNVYKANTEVDVTMIIRSCLLWKNAQQVYDNQRVKLQHQNSRKDEVSKVIV